MRNDLRPDQEPIEITIGSLNLNVARKRGIAPKTAMRWVYGLAGIALYASNWSLGVWASTTHNQMALGWAEDNRLLTAAIAVLAAAYAFRPTQLVIAAVRRLLNH